MLILVVMLDVQLSLLDIAQYFQRGSNKTEEQVSMPFQICRHLPAWDLNVVFLFLLSF